MMIIIGINLDLFFLILQGIKPKKLHNKTMLFITIILFILINIINKIITIFPINSGNIAISFICLYLTTTAINIIITNIKIIKLQLETNKKKKTI